MRQSAYFISGTSVRENEPLFNTFLGTFHLHKLSDNLLGECNYHSSLHGLKWFKYVHAYIFKRATIHESVWKNSTDVAWTYLSKSHYSYVNSYCLIGGLLTFPYQFNPMTIIRYIVNLISDIRYLMDTFDNVHL